MIDLGQREPFVQMLEGQLGRALAPQVRHAFLQVPRHLFVQQYYAQRGNSLSWDRVQALPEQVYRDEALVTQIDERGVPSSSTSQPSVMAVQLEMLALSPGQRVLEIGVGTGYNAALLAKLVGESGQVISIDIDEGLVELAKQHLRDANVHTVLALLGDGSFGKADYAPYDRILATCSIRAVPHAWFDQLKIGGRLVGNWHIPLASLFVCIEKTGPDELSGGLFDLQASYMEMHTPGAVSSKQKVNWQLYETQTPTSIPFPAVKTTLRNPAACLLLQCFLPHIKKRYRSKDDQIQLYLVTSEATILVEDDRLLVFGDAESGQIVQQSLDLYQQLGQPRITEFGVTLNKRQAMIRVANHQFHLPVPL